MPVGVRSPSEQDTVSCSMKTHVAASCFEVGCVAECSALVKIGVEEWCAITR